MMGDLDDSANSKRVLVLLSGGIDSTACATFFVAQHFEVLLLFVDYGQPAAAQESAAAHYVADYYQLQLRCIKCEGFAVSAPGYIPGRNAFLLQCGLICIPFDSGLIAIGIHAGTSYVDCGQGILDCTQRTFDLYTDGQVQVSAPFLTWTKSEIVKYLHEASFPISRTYSCEVGQNSPCGICLSCRDRSRLDV